MTRKRLQNIINEVVKKYQYQPITDITIEEFYDTMSGVIKGLHASEHFLNVSIDFGTNMIFVRDDETMEYLGMLPYLDSRLKDNEELFFVYFLHPYNMVTLQGAVIFKDLHKYKAHTIGYSMDVFNAYTAGIYYPDTGEFRTFK